MEVFKKAWSENCDDVIVRLRVDAKKVVRPRGGAGKMRAAKALVLSITARDNPNIRYKKCRSTNYGGGPRLEYIVGKVARAHELNDDENQSCGAGINFFRTRDEAVNYIP